MTALVDEVEPELVTYPVPPGRGRWRLTLHRRAFASGTTWQSTLISELPRARGRRLEQKWNQAATLTFTLDGHDAEAALIAELAHDVIAWRWDDTAGLDRPMFRGVIGQSEDQVADKHVVTFTAHDYLAVIGRRFNTTVLSWANNDQDDIANGLVSAAGASAASSAGASFLPGSYLPVSRLLCNPDGTTRASSGVLRARTYAGSTNLGTALQQLAACESGFDFDVLPMGAADHQTDALRIFFPQQGVVSGQVLEYGGNLSAVTRSLSSDSYANYIRKLGNNGQSDPAAPQTFAETQNSDATGVVVGWWPMADNSADVSVGLTLQQQAAGGLAYYGTLLPSYTVTLVPGWYYYGALNMGDVVPLVIRSGRLNVTGSPTRVVGLSFSVGESGDENVEVTLGRPVQSLTTLLAATARDVDALARR